MNSDGTFSSDPLVKNDGYEYVYVGELEPGMEVRTLGVIKKVEIGSMTYTIYFENANTTIRTWHKFHSVEVKQES